MLAFDACLHAFGQEATPHPGRDRLPRGQHRRCDGADPRRHGCDRGSRSPASLTAVTGINFGIATSIAILFRVVTYWLRIPIGWVAMQYLQKKDEL